MTQVLVIDASGSSQLQNLVEEYAIQRALHVTYHRRSKAAREPEGGWPKASTLNFGLTETRAEGRISGEYVIVLEADVRTLFLARGSIRGLRNG